MSGRANEIDAGTGLSAASTLFEAVDEAWAQATRSLRGAPTTVMVHSGVGFLPERVLERLRVLAGPDARIFGGTAQGATVGHTTVEQLRFVAIAAFSGLSTRFAAIPQISDGHSAGTALAEQLGPPPRGPHTTLLYYDPLGGVNAQAILDALDAGGYPIVHGSATGQPWGRFHKTWQFANDVVSERGAIAVVLEGVSPVWELTHGAEATGLRMVVTRADDNVVFELDGRPALAKWREQLGLEAGHDVQDTADWALGVEPPSPVYEGLITRAPFSMDEERGALVFQAPIPEGSRVQVCIRNRDAVYEGAQKMGGRMRDALDAHAGEPVLMLGLECGARPEPFLGRDLAHEEVCELRETIGASIPWFGAYAWGEIAPVGERSYFHNFTFPLCALMVE